MSRYIPDSLKKQVIERANYCCEYCLQPDLFAYIAHQIDHIISIKHGVIYAKTTIGQATIKVLNLNDINRIIERND